MHAHASMHTHHQTHPSMHLRACTCPFPACMHICLRARMQVKFTMLDKDFIGKDDNMGEVVLGQICELSGDGRDEKRLLTGGPKPKPKGVLCNPRV